MPVIPLPQTCSIYRAQPDTGRENFHTGAQTWTLIGTARCRVDFSFLFSSRQELRREDVFGRNEGFLFLDPDADVQPNDVIVVDGSHYANQQFNIRYVDPAVDGVGVHHLEATISRRDELVPL